jgi:adenosylmethionine-8-amino-7-oxononanoate aminotransferase
VPFVDYLFDVEYLPFPEGDGKNTIEVMRTIADDSVAAFIFEPLVQGAAGMRIYTPDVLEQLMETAHAHQIICIADEVMTGFGRTGKTFACDYLNTQPDIFCLSKGITGGFLPMGVTTVNERIAEAFNHADKSKAFFHGHSYTANPMACASAVASMDLLISEPTQADIHRISEKHQKYLSTFRFHAQVDHAKTLGTILSITLPATDSGYVSSIKERIYDFFMGRNLLLRPLGNVIYLIPPYVITDEMLDEVYGAIDAFFEDLLLDS